MFDVHPIAKKIEGLKDFGLHILTITIGLLIALSLEGIVEYQHHRNLVHAARTSLRAEVDRNATLISNISNEIEDAQKVLNGDQDALTQYEKDFVANVVPARGPQLTLEFHIRSFEDTAWKTSQATGALSYMPYDEVVEFSTIYDTQDEVYKVQQQALDDILSAASLIAAKNANFLPSSAVVDEDSNRIGLVKMRLAYEKSIVESLEANYKQFKADHS